MNNVVEMGAFRITSKPSTRRPDGCAHRNFTIDAVGQIVTCDDCDKQIGAHWALTLLCDTYVKAMEQLQRERELVGRAAALHVDTSAAKRVESAWRSRTMVPTCPHCHEAIFPQDGFGGSATNREIALRRRETKKGGAG